MSLLIPAKAHSVVHLNDTTLFYLNKREILSMSPKYLLKIKYILKYYNFYDIINTNTTNIDN